MRQESGNNDRIIYVYTIFLLQKYLTMAVDFIFSKTTSYEDLRNLWFKLARD